MDKKSEIRKRKSTLTLSSLSVCRYSYEPGNRLCVAGVRAVAGRHVGPERVNIVRIRKAVGSPSVLAR